MLAGRRGGSGIALVPGRIDTRWFQNHIGQARSLCFVRSRITFVGAPDPAKFPSVFAYFGRGHLRAFERHFGNHGMIVRP